MSPGLKFHFVAVPGSDNTANAESKRLARSHVAMNSLQSKRQSLRQHQNNFLVVTQREWSTSSKKRRCQSVPSPLLTVGLETFDPFKSWAVDLTKLQILLNHGK